jgi:hypothetical protein
MGASIGDSSPGTPTNQFGLEMAADCRIEDLARPSGMGRVLARQHRPFKSGTERFLEGAIAALEQQIRASHPLRPTDFVRLGLAVVPLRESGFILTARYENRLDIRVQPAPLGESPAESGLRWNVLGAWQPDRAPKLHMASIDEWLGLSFADAFALVRGMINEAVAESRGVPAVADCFSHRGRTILNPFRDAFGNETSPSSEYGESYFAWRARSPFVSSVNSEKPSRP